MARKERDRPYSQFNFRVSWDKSATSDNGESMSAEDVWGGFQEISGLGAEITVAEYRAGTYTRNVPIKVTGMVKTPDVTFKRGVLGRNELYKWVNSIRDGSQQHRKNVLIELRSEDNADTVQSWRLLDARPMKWTGPSLNGKGTDLAVEELVLAAEDIELLPDDDDKSE